MDKIFEYRHSKNELLESVLQTIYHVGKLGAINPGYINLLTHSEKKLEVSFPLKLDNGEVKIFSGGFVQHSTILGPSIGSIDIISQATMEDCEALAMLMSLQTAVLGIPMGGSKGIIFADISELNQEETERLYKAYIREVLKIFGNDSNIIKLFENESAYTAYPIIDIVEKTFGNTKSVVNRPAEYFGTGLISEAQAISIGQCIRNVLETYDTKDLINVQVGIAMGDSNETVDMELLVELNRIGLPILGFAVDEENQVKTYWNKIWQTIYNTQDEYYNQVLHVQKVSDYDNLEESTVINANVDVLVLEDKNILVTPDMAEKIKAKYIIEAESNQLTRDAEVILEDNGSIVIPDFISLGGILINGYIEWTQGSAASIITKSEWRNIISSMLSKSLKGIFELRKDLSLTTKEAAILYAVKKLADIREKKGFSY